MRQVRTLPRLQIGIVAILRGIGPAHAKDIALALVEQGIRAIEIPLNSPDPFRSIEVIRACTPDDCLIGAGTVLEAGDVARLASAGGELLVAPNFDPGVVEAARRANMITMPGVFSPGEAIAASRFGVSALKFFPASVLGTGGVSAIRAILPADTAIAAVGGVEAGDFARWSKAGIRLFGIGSGLYRAGDDHRTVASRARSAVDAWRLACSKLS